MPLKLVCVSGRLLWETKAFFTPAPVPSGDGTLFSLPLKASVLSRWLYLPLKQVVHAFRGGHYPLSCFIAVLFCLDQAIAARNRAGGGEPVLWLAITEHAARDRRALRGAESHPPFPGILLPELSFRLLLASPRRKRELVWLE